MKIKKIYRIWAYNSHINLCVLEWYTSIKEVRLRAEKLLANGFDYIDDIESQRNKPIELSFNFHPDDMDLVYYRQLKAGVKKEKDGAEVKLQCSPAFGSPGVVDICITCSKLQADGHCAHEEIVGVEGCSYYDERR